MALRLIAGLGCKFNDPTRLLAYDVSTIPGLDTDGTTDAGALTPTDGGYFVKLARDASASGAGYQLSWLDAVTAKAYSYVAIRDFIVEGSLPAGNFVPIQFEMTAGAGQTLNLGALQVSSSACLTTG